MKQLPTRNLRGSAKGGLIERCGKCGCKVALVLPHPALDASPWRCRGCGVIFLASPERREGSLFHGGVLPANFSDVFQPIELYGGERRPELSMEDVQQLKRCIPSRSEIQTNIRQTERRNCSTGDRADAGRGFTNSRSSCDGLYN